MNEDITAFVGRKLNARNNTTPTSKTLIRGDNDAMDLLKICGQRPFGKAVIPSFSGHTKGGSIPQKQSLVLEKFAESFWKLTMFSLFLALGLYVTHDSPWLTDSRHFWIGYPNHTFSWKLRMLYVVELAFYVPALFTIWFWEVRRADHTVIAIHHLVTVILVGFSYMNGYLRVGSIVMMLHDVNDVFMEGAKLCKYCNLHGVANVVFGCFVCSWVLMRLCLFPGWVLRSTLWELWAIVGPEAPHYHLFNGLLIGLLCLHLYWSWWILLLVKRVLVDKLDVDDERED